LCTLALLLVAATYVSPAGDVIVYTANQDFLSRIYVLKMDGSIHDFFEYEFYRFVDTEVVNNALYVSEAFAPRMYKVNIENGELELIIDDWSLYYFYGLAFDGIYFYVDEWDLNRYEVDGTKDGTASFDGDVFGSAWDGSYLWTLDDTDVVKCWDISGWPSVIQVPSNNFAPPSPDCRGLWFDGEYFWSAESLDGLGYIYQFDYSGSVIDQWLEPAYRGWSACVIRDFITSTDEIAPSSILSDAKLSAHPNPVRGHAEIGLMMPHSSFASLKVYNLAGEEIETLFSGMLPAGPGCFRWDATGIASGVYFVRLDASRTIAARKVLVIH
jgi:hypothetical protein